jgi:hypothetical protein
MNYKKSDFTCSHSQTELKKWKKEFIKRQRENQAILRDRSSSKLKYLFKTDKNSFWKEMEKQRSNKISTDAPIEKLHKEFSDLFNKKLLDNEDQEETSRAKVELFKLENENKCFDYSIDDKIIKELIRSIPNGKSIGSAEVSGEMFKYGVSNILISILNIFFTKIIRSRIVPYFFNVGIIKPIVKDTNGDANDVNNLRPITISDILANLYERIIMIEIEKDHKDHEKQFGFKAKSSCNHAVFTMREAILFSRQNNRKAYVTLIDASKAFDKINRTFLWDKLITKIRPVILLSLMSYYKESYAYIENNGNATLIFRTTRGVKQGGPLSPKLFAIYIEDIILEVEAARVGISIGEMRIDIILYADDIALMSNSLEGLNTLLEITEKFGNKWEVKFNPTKTVYLAYGVSQKEIERPKFDGVEIQRVKSAKYLGVWINDKMSSTDHVSKRIVGTMARIKELDDTLNASSLPPNMKVFIYKTYARPVLYYGLENMILNKGESKALQTVESSIIKHMLGLRKCAKSTELLYANELEKSDLRLKQLKCNFFIRIIDNSYTKKLCDAINGFYELYPTKIISDKSFLKVVKDCVVGPYRNLATACIDTLKYIESEIQSWHINETVKKIKQALTNENHELLDTLTYVNFRV